MSDDNVKDKQELVLASTRTEKTLDVAAMGSNVVPWIGGVVAAVLSGMSANRKLGRVREVLEGVANDLKDFKSEVSESYVKTEEFEELLEKTLLKAADERSDEKQRVYRNFLVDTIESPGQSYDEQLRFLRALEELQPDHIKVLRAFIQGKVDPSLMASSPGQTLVARLPDIPEERVRELVSQLNDMRITNMTSFHVLMTGAGAQNLQHYITPFGQRLMSFIKE
jgi:pyruvate-formate lyase-activating enzyme